MTPLEFAPEAVLFDMDGLMIDSERALLECWREAARNLDLPLGDDLWLAMVGLHDTACHGLLRARLREDEVQALLDDAYARYRARVAAGLPSKPGVFELLALLHTHGIPRAVVTSTRRERALTKLESCGLLPHFAVVVTGSDVTAPKPAPEGYLRAARTLGVAPRRCVVLEDSGPGVRAALAAGMTPIQVPDLVEPDVDVRALGHRIVASLAAAQALIAPRLMLA